MSNHEPLVLAGGADNAFAMPLAVAVYSALRNLSGARPVELYVLDGGIHPRNRQSFVRVVNRSGRDVRLHWITPDLAPIADLKPTPWTNLTTYLRLLLPEVVSADATRVIYIDSDTVVEGDLGELWELEMGDDLLLAVADYYSPRMDQSESMAGRYEAFGISGEAPYLNAGVLVMNLAGWRAEGIATRAIRAARDHGFLYADQDAINVTVAGRWRAIDPRWNVMLSVLDRYGEKLGLTQSEATELHDRLLREAKILHFTGAVKPWHDGVTGAPSRRFRHYLRASGWFSPPKYTLWTWERSIDPRVKRAVVRSFPRSAVRLAKLLLYPLGM